MPEISRFLGILVSMHWNDHAPPHFHVRYGGRSATVEIRPLRLLDGRLPPRVLGCVIEWAALHQEELLEDWRLARENRPLKRIAPLE